MEEIKKSALDGFELLKDPRGKKKEAFFFSMQKNYIVFSRGCMESLHKAETVKVYYNRENKQLAIEEAEANSPEGFDFTRNWKQNGRAVNRNGEECNTARITNQGILRLVREIAAWPEESGLRAYGTFHPEEKVIIFDLGRIERTTPGRKRR